MTQNWKEVTSEEFMRVIGPQDVHPTPVGKYPYTSLFKDRQGRVKGKIVSEGIAVITNTYLLPA